MPSKKLKVALDVLSDMVKNPLFDKKELDKERNVIFEEIKMRKDEPKTYVFDRIQSCLFGGTLGKDLIGTHETMSSITREKMVHRFKEVYHPNNMILCVVGDANFEDLCSFAEKNFPLTNGEVKAYPFSEKNKSVIEKRKGVDQANFVFAFHAPKAKDKKSFAMEALITLMAQGSSSRLFQEIREKRNLAYGVKGATSVSRDHAYGVVYVGTSKDKVGPVRNIIIQEFKKAAKNITKSELERVKEQMIGIQQVSMEDSSVQMTHLLLEEINGTFEESYRFEGNVRKITLDEVRKLAKQVSEKYSFFALIPN